MPCGATRNAVYLILHRHCWKHHAYACHKTFVHMAAMTLAACHKHVRRKGGKYAYIIIHTKIHETNTHTRHAGAHTHKHSR